MYVFTKNYWIHFFSLRTACEALLASLGVFWLSIEVLSFFSGNKVDPNIKNHWYVFVLGSFLWTVVQTRPTTRLEIKIPGRDVIIEVVIEDPLYLENRTRVVGSNTQFATSVVTSSLSSKCIQKYYRSKADADAEIGLQLNGESPCDCKPDGTIYYQVGTVVKLMPQPSTKLYFLAIAKKNSYGKSSTCETDLFEALEKLWGYLSTRGTVEDIVVPLLGTGTAMLATKREIIVVKLIESFLKASERQVFCPRLIVAISPDDFHQFRLEPKRFFEFVEYYFVNIFSR